MELWHKFIPAENCFSTFYIDAVLNNVEGLFITLKKENDARGIVVVFEYSIYSEKVVPRNEFMKKMQDLDEQYGVGFSESWSFFRVENSAYLGWLKEQSYGVYEHEKEDYKMKHYVLIGTNFVMEILAPYVPTIKIEDR